MFFINSAKMFMEYSRLKQPVFEKQVSESGDLQFPQTIGFNLEGKRFELPHDFQYDINIVAIAFEQWQQTHVDTWLPHLDTLAATYSQLGYYEFPTIATMSPMAQATVDGWMRMGIPDRAARQRTITLYLEVKRFCDALDLPYTHDIYVMVVDRNGAVKGYVEGEYTTAKLTALKEIINELRSYEHQELV